MKLFILLVCSAFISVSAFAGKIRTIEVSSKRMESIYLKLGQSTVLRFRETPKKVVVGNQNYFSVEFIGNDITIDGIVNSFWELADKASFQANSRN